MMKLYHTGFEQIKKPDIHFGRKNADFYQGFYLSDNLEFSMRWAKVRKDKDTILNTYRLNTEGLKIKRLERNEEWFEYIFKNRSGYADSLAEYDVIIGPIANDTIYDIWGITTSGLLPKEMALEILLIGAEYKQIVIKSEKAAENLKFLSSAVLDKEEIKKYADDVKKEENEYQSLVSEKLGNIIDI